MKTVVLIQETDSDGRVWYRVNPRDTEFLAEDPSARVKEGNWIFLVGRALKVMREGGYNQGDPPPGGATAPNLARAYVTREDRFMLDPSEIYLCLEIPSKKGKGKSP